MSQQAPEGPTRLERDSMGELQVPAGAYYGATSHRAQLNFPISDLRFNRSFIKAIGQIKQAASRVNRDLDALEPALADAIDSAAQKVIDGEYDDQFVVDIFQTGSGTSTNMNANEVISNVAIKALGGEIGSRSPVHPNDHVNKGQSSNDVIPTAIHLAAAGAIRERLLPAMAELEGELRKKSEEFWPVIKTGRTHLQDATPIRLGQEFSGYVGQMEYGRQRVESALAELSVLAIGGTAVGTGIGMHPEFAGRMIARLREMTGLDLSETANHFQSQSTLDAVVEASGSMKTIAVSLMKIANDIRWLGSGPRAGIGEIELPEVQPGSSIMPGKINPVIAESVTMVCAQVIGNDVTIAIAGQSGNFEINVMMPVAAYNLLQSIDLLAASCENFARQCVSGLKATSKGPGMVEQGLAIGTALAPVIGYDAAAAIAHEASETGETIKQVAQRLTDLSSERLDEILEPSRMTEPS
ncbi:MAG: class II fumarate hydratase [Chloroflexi bacterium]|nr:class II fumarate hydratase [Chloroflexota bacterium]